VLATSKNSDAGKENIALENMLWTVDCYGLDIISGMNIHYKKVYPGGIEMQVSKWGNSLAIRLPAAVVEALRLHEGDDIEVVIEDERVFQVRKKPDRDALLTRLRKFRGKLPADFKFDREDANARD